MLLAPGTVWDTYGSAAHVAAREPGCQQHRWVVHLHLVMHRRLCKRREVQSTGVLDDRNLSRCEERTNPVTRLHGYALVFVGWILDIVVMAQVHVKQANPYYVGYILI